MLDDHKRSHLIRVNMICNEGCFFCNVTPETEPGYKERSIFEILTEVQRLIKKSESKKIKIAISGGEPTLRTDLTKIIAGIKKLGVNHIELQTNALLLDRTRAAMLASVGITSFFVSFHSHEKDVFEGCVGRRGVFDRVVKNIKDLRYLQECEVILNPVISRKNYKQLPSYFDYVKNNFPFVRYISLSFMQPHGNATKNMGEFLDYDEVNKTLHGILRYAHSLGLVVNNPYCGLPICVLGWDEYTENCIEIVEGTMLSDSGAARFDTNKVYVEACSNCRYIGLCGGVWREYVEHYKDRGISPII